MSSVASFRLFDGMYEGLVNALDLCSARHALTAANIANANTPGYLAKELPFQELLSTAMDAPLSGEAVSMDELVRGSIIDLEAPAFSLDGNSVDIEREQGREVETQVLYEALAGGMSRRLAMLRFAATDGKF